LIENSSQNAVSAFNESAGDYDRWFDSHPEVFQSELKALRTIMPRHGIGLEIGVGSGRFAEKLGISFGVEPAPAMRVLAEKRGVQVVEGVAESLPFPDGHFDFAALINTLCFVNDPLKTLQEAKRVLVPGGRIILGIIDRKSPLGKEYEKKRGSNPYYRYAHFLSTEEVVNFLEKLDFMEIQIFQTLFVSPEELKALDEVEEGYGKGGFVVIGGTKTR